MEGAHFEQNQQRNFFFSGSRVYRPKPNSVSNKLFKNPDTYNLLLQSPCQEILHLLPIVLLQSFYSKHLLEFQKI